MGVGDGRREPAGKVGAVSDMDGEMGLVALGERAREGKGGRVHAGHDGGADAVFAYDVRQQGARAAVVDAGDEEGESDADELEGCCW